MIGLRSVNYIFFCLVSSSYLSLVPLQVFAASEDKLSHLRNHIGSHDVVGNEKKKVLKISVSLAFYSDKEKGNQQKNVQFQRKKSATLRTYLGARHTFWMDGYLIELVPKSTGTQDAYGLSFIVYKSADNV